MEFEFDKKSILDAITKGIHAIFGDDYNIETGEVKQGMEKPCFFVRMLNGEEKHQRGQRYKRNLNFLIIGFSQNDDVVKLYDMADKLYNLNYVELANGDLLRCINKSDRVEDNTLQFFFDIKCFIYKNATVDPQEKMENVTVEIKK